MCVTFQVKHLVNEKYTTSFKKAYQSYSVTHHKKHKTRVFKLINPQLCQIVNSLVVSGWHCGKLPSAATLSIDVCCFQAM